MKLYATVTSERATKGQGGNDFLQIAVMAGNADKQKQIASILVSVDGDAVHVFPEYMIKQSSLSEITKGNKQKDDTMHFFCDRHNPPIEVNWTAQEIAQKGTPVCPECDEDMMSL